MTQEPILITGAARSGTSMVAGIVHLSGAFGGKLAGPNSNNKKGMFENRMVVNELVKPYLRSIKADPMGQEPLPNMQIVKEHARDVARVDALRRGVKEIMLRDGYDGGPWFYKGAKMCLMWPLWHAAFPNAKWIFVRRPTDQIVASCMRTTFMRNRKTEEAWRLWVAEHVVRNIEMSEAGLDVKEVWSDYIVKGDFRQIRYIVLRSGLEWREDMVKDFVEPALYNKGESNA